MIKYAFWDCTHSISNKFLRHYLRELFYELHYEFPLTINHDLERIVEHSLDCDYLVVMQSGLTLKNPELFKMAIIDFCDDEDFFISGQIISHADNYPFIHPQLFIIDMNRYQQYGQPMIGYHEDSDVLDLHKPQRSSENSFEDYTPHWLKPSGETVACSRRDFGWNLIHTSLDNGMPVKALRGPLSWTKRYLYPNNQPHTFAALLEQQGRGEALEIPDSLDPNQRDFVRGLGRVFPRSRRRTDDHRTPGRRLVAHARWTRRLQHLHAFRLRVSLLR